VEREARALAAEFRRQLRERPYWTGIAVLGVGWVLGRSLPLRAMIALVGIGARAAASSALEDAVRTRLGGRPRSQWDGEEDSA
jgi:hypothetical protein